MDQEDEYTDPGHFGERLAKLREHAGITQRDLAKKVRVSQATISRLESSAEPPSDILLLSRLARELDTTFSELAPGIELRSGTHEIEREGEFFFSFCPNPFCQRNKRDMLNGAHVMYWTSYDGFPCSEFNEVNYCESCGTELVKECPNCQKRLGKKWTRFCTRCGKRIIERPTDEEWVTIKKLVKPAKPEDPPASAGDEIPF